MIGNDGLEWSHGLVSCIHMRCDGLSLRLRKSVA